MSQYFTCNAIAKICPAEPGRTRFSDRILFLEKQTRTAFYMSVQAKAQLAGVLREKLGQAPASGGFDPSSESYVAILAFGQIVTCLISKKPEVLIQCFEVVPLGGKTAAHELGVHWRGQGTSSNGS